MDIRHYVLHFFVYLGEFRHIDTRFPVCGEGAVDAGVQDQLPHGRRWHFDVLRAVVDLAYPICIGASWNAIQDKVKEYMVAFLVLETMMVGMFCALDFVAFYIFFEAVLIPMFLIIGVWGGPRRVYAAFKFFLYTLLGSVLMLLAILVAYFQAGTTDIPTLMAFDFPLNLQYWMWLAFFASFAVKVPMWPVHTLVAGCARRSADGRLRHLGGCLAEDGRIRVLALLATDVAGSLRVLHALGLRHQYRRGDLHVTCRFGAGGYEEAHRIFVHCAYGVRHGRDLRRQRAGDRRLDHSDVEPRYRLRGTLPLRWRGVRPYSFA